MLVEATFSFLATLDRLEGVAYIIGVDFMLPTYKSKCADRARDCIDSMIHRGDLARGNRPTRDAYFRLVQSLRETTDLLHHNRIGRRESPKASHVVSALPAIADRYFHWKRAPETYVPDEGASLMQQWIGFVQHLIELQPCPNFLSISWLHPRREKWWEELHIYMSTGRSPRRFRLPDNSISDRTTVKYLLLAPDDATPSEAFRWAQYMAVVEQMNLECDRVVAGALMKNIPIGDSPDAEAFWKETLRFFAIHPVAENEVREIVEMIVMYRFTPICNVSKRWRYHDQPLDRDFSIVSRSLSGLRSGLMTWRKDYEARLASRPYVPSDMRWDSIGIDEMTLPSIDGSHEWRIVELRRPSELKSEGSQLSHCVGSYVSRCRRGLSSIWSLQRVQGDQIQSVITFEIHPGTMRIVQARGYRNRRVNAEQAQLIRAFAEANEITMTERSLT